MESANLNCLRSIAVICVFVCHAVKMYGINSASMACLGRIGVVLFFIHTALVLMMSMERNGANWFSFMVRRIFRIYPLAIVAVLIYFPLNIAQTSQDGITAEATTRTFFINLGLVQNVFNVAAIPGVLWSLPYELQMYLFLPALYLLVRNRNKLDLVSLWLIFAALVMGLAIFTPSSISMFLKYVPCFMAGVICFPMKRTNQLSGYLFPLFVLSVVAACVTIGVTSDLIFWPFCLLIGCLIPVFREIRNRATNIAFATVAKYSFGIYLFHELILYALVNIAGKWIGVIASIPVTLFISWVCFCVVEDPLIKIGKRISSRKQNSQTRILEPSLS